MYIIEIVHRYNLQGISLQGLSLPGDPIAFQVVGEGEMFSVHQVEVTEQQLKAVLPYLEVAQKMGDIVDYFYQNKATF